MVLLIHWVLFSVYGGEDLCGSSFLTGVHLVAELNQNWYKSSKSIDVMQEQRMGRS